MRAWVRRSLSSSESGTTSRAATLGVDARASAARSVSGVSCSWPTAETIGTRQDATARTSRSSLKGRRSSKLPPPRAITITSRSCDRAEILDRRCERRRRPRALDVGLRHDDARGWEAGRDRRQDVPLRGGVVAGHEPDSARKPGQPTLALGREEAFGGQLLLQSLERSEVVAEAEALDRERPEAEVATRLEELRTAVDVHPLAVPELESERVELPTRHRHGQAGTVARILEREEDALPALLPPELGDLALDPDRGQSREPGGNAAVERGDGENLPIAVLLRLDLHEARIRLKASRLREESRRRPSRRSPA